MNTLLVTVKPVLNIFAEPSREAEVTSQAIYGSVVEMLEQQDTWARVRTADDYSGWALCCDFLPQTNELDPNDALRVIQISANVYLEPDVTLRAPLLNLPSEARLQRVRDDHAGDRWLRVRLLDGQGAYIQRGDVAFDPPSLTLGETLALAHRLIGITYTWGGISTRGFDCSGFVQMLHRQHGIVIPRDAQAQADWSGFFRVSAAELIAGDVLFFGESPAAITHVGLYLGEGSFIHDTTHGHPGVQVSRLEDDHWNGLLCAQRRLKQ